MAVSDTYWDNISDGYSIQDEIPTTLAFSSVNWCKIDVFTSNIMVLQHKMFQTVKINVNRYTNIYLLMNAGADPGFDQGGPQVMTGLKLPFWGLSFVEFWCWGLIFGGRGGGARAPGPPPGSAPGMYSKLINFYSFFLYFSFIFIHTVEYCNMLQTNFDQNILQNLPLSSTVSES